MLNLQLGWQSAGVLSIGLFTGAAAAPLLRWPVATRGRPYLREAGVVATLYTLWQLAGSFSVLDNDGAFSRARSIVRVEAAARLPSEHDVQQLISGHSLITQAANWYYAGVHFTALGVMLLWLFVRHRDRYPRVRNVLVLLTATSLMIQWIPVAPPRLLPGYVDTAARYGESVYNLGGISVDQLAAMPSVHVGWALLVAWAVIGCGASRWRWWVVAHPLLTVFVVLATANHFWLDAIVSAGLFGLSIAAVRLLVPALTSTWPDDGDSSGTAVAHAGEGGGDLVESDRGGDEFVGSHSAGAD
jgi:PAP2 superfamily